MANDLGVNTEGTIDRPEKQGSVGPSTKTKKMKRKRTDYLRELGKFMYNDPGKDPNSPWASCCH